MRELKDTRDTRDSRDRERDREGRDRERERDRDRGRDREFSSREKTRSGKRDVPVAPMTDHRAAEEKQRPRSSQELKHPRSAALSGVLLPLLAEVNFSEIFKFNQ